MNMGPKSTKNVTLMRIQDTNSEAALGPEKMETEMGKRLLRAKSAKAFQ